MAGFDPSTDVFSMTEKVILGTTGALSEIEMEGYDSDDLEGMIEGVTTGAMSAINELQRAGLDQNNMSNMMKSISSSASKGLSRLENSKLLDNASKLPGLLNTITSSTLKATKEIKVQGFDKALDLYFFCRLQGGRGNGIQQSRKLSLIHISEPTRPY